VHDLEDKVENFRQITEKLINKNMKATDRESNQKVRISLENIDLAYKEIKSE
jgi:hypothetical protein